MDKLIAIIVTMVAVVALCTVVIFNGIAPSVETKSDAVIGNIDGLDYGGGL